MRPVNLLPAGDRARRPASTSKNASYIVLGVLGALLLVMLTVVVTQNQINSRTSEIAAVKQETAEAQQRTAALGPFGQFATIKETRVQSVTQLAQARFDWERLMRELALVLPEDTWITSASASAAGAPEGGAAAASPTGTTATSIAPSVNLVGCAPTQSVVAEVMVRMRNLHRAQDVELTESARPDEQPVVPGAAPVAAEPTGTAGGCGDRYQFNTTVTFAPATDVGLDDEQGDSVPSSLGGGS